MNLSELIMQAERIKKLCETEGNGINAYLQAVEFIKNHVGTNNSFLSQFELVDRSKRSKDSYLAGVVSSVLGAFIDYAKNGLLTVKTEPRKNELPAVFTPKPAEVKQQDRTFSEMLKNALKLAAGEDIHPCTPVIITGSVLEQMLREKTEALKLKPEMSDPNSFVYSRMLMDHGVFTRDEAAAAAKWASLYHDIREGNFEKAEDENTVGMMIKGVEGLMLKVNAYKN